MNINEKILDKITGYAVDIQRYEATVQRKIIKDLKQLETKLVVDLKRSKVITTVNKKTQQKRLKALLVQTRESISQAYKDISKEQIVI